MQTVEPFGVTNDRLDEVSNYYRYNRSRGEWWRHTQAAAYATVSAGVVTGFLITNPGSGYSSPPRITVPGFPDANGSASLTFSTDFKTNGSLREIKLADSK